MRGERSIWWLPTVIAGLYAVVVGVYGVARMLFGDDGGSWTGLANAVAGSGLIVWLAVVLVSAIIRFVRTR